jgi:hypothetical protein
MARYIDADILRKNEIARCHCVPCVGSNDNNYKDLDEVLNDCPTADVAPRIEVAREIIDEFLNTMRLKHEENRPKYGGALALLLPDIEQIAAELKKKYTEPDAE